MSQTPYLKGENWGDLREIFAGKVYALVPVTSGVKGVQWSVGVAVANEPGYSPLPVSWCNSDEYDWIAGYCEGANEAQLQLSDDVSMRIIASTMCERT